MNFAAKTGLEVTVSSFPMDLNAKKSWLQISSLLAGFACSEAPLFVSSLPF
jgi:hypothetical protein